MEPVSLSCLSIRPPRWRRRRCLLKGCGQSFQPTQAQCRYCSVVCRAAARRWRRWRAQQKYRASPKGRAHRQQQACRYRQRCHNPPPPTSAPPAAAPPPTSAPPATAAGAAAGPEGNTLAVCEGRRLLENGEKVPLCPCDRPGCYVLFPAAAADNPRRFCCGLCRKALRCVLDREASWRRRRRRGLRRPGRRSQPRPRAP